MPKYFNALSEEDRLCSYKDFRRGGFDYQFWTDGIVVISIDQSDQCMYRVERAYVLDHPRNAWHVVDRRDAPEESMEPPIIAGPFTTLKGALTALRILAT